MNTYLITGASGFFGTSLLETLKKTNTCDRFVCVYHSRKQEINDSRFTWIKANLLDVKSHRELMQKFKPTHCAHLAWHVPPQNFWHAEENLAWLQASVQLFQTFCEFGGKMFMGAGSLAEYDWSSGVLDEEKTILVPRSLYGQCKKSLYEILKVIRDTKYKDIVLLWPRIGYFFGAGEPHQKLISKIINGIKTGKTLKLVSKDAERPYAHVKYLGDYLAYILLNQKEDVVFNLSASTAYPLGEIVDFIGNKLNISRKDVLYDSYPTSPFEPLILKVSTEILSRILGRSLRDTFFEDLHQTIKLHNTKHKK